MRYKCCLLFFSIFLASSLLFAEVAFVQIDFTPADHFAIPEKNSIINFADSGFYDSVDFQENTWYFTNLTFNEGAASYTSVLAISASNCNVTITHYDPPANVVGDDPFRPSWLNYTVVGKGSQEFNFHLMDYPSVYNWKVIIDGAEKTRNNGWTLSEDGWLTVTEPTSAVSIRFESISPPKEGPPREPYLELILLVILGIVVASFLLWVFRRKRKP